MHLLLAGRGSLTRAAGGSPVGLLWGGRWLLVAVAVGLQVRQEAKQQGSGRLPTTSRSIGAGGGGLCGRRVCLGEWGQSRGFGWWRVWSRVCRRVGWDVIAAAGGSQHTSLALGCSAARHFFRRHHHAPASVQAVEGWGCLAWLGLERACLVDRSINQSIDQCTHDDEEPTTMTNPQPLHIRGIRS